ncbi:hypothetical protein K435DRAFT_965778 [Dendrothele bispora CBS 962.96]|uniref:Uncharacterized protein n=1 Tax=Dendrothele bispora (strain CBS 962.96) TaxID=1314807 RepID=A0A4S8M3T2_DENBC|nr:hypothetical protein K435DRAFT_965778 [Dendrothele bispora CBS 962.96]
MSIPSSPVGQPVYLNANTTNRPTNGNGNPTASVVRFSNPIPPAVTSPRGNTTHHIVDVNPYDTGTDSVLNYNHAYGHIVNPHSESRLPVHKRVFKIIRRLLEEIWIDLVFFHLPRIYQERVGDVALRVRRNAHLQRRRVSKLRGELDGYSGDEGTDLEVETDNNTHHDNADGNDSGTSLKHSARQSNTRIGQEPRLNHESVTAFTEDDDMDLTEWGNLVGDFLQEWKTMVVAAALMFPATFTLLQLTPADPISRTGCILSFTCAAVSLLGGLIGMLRFAGARGHRKATVWMKRAFSNRFISWNPWIALSIPLAWFIWSIMFLLASTMAFTWRSTAGSSLTSLGVSPSEVVISSKAILGIRIGVSALLGLGLFTIVLMFATLEVVDTRGSLTSRLSDVSYRHSRKRSIAGPTRQRVDSQTTDAHSEVVSRTEQTDQPVTPAVHPASKQMPVEHAEQSLAFPILPSTSMTDVRGLDVPSPDTSAEPQSSPQNSPPQEILPYLSPGSGSDTQLQASRSDPALPIEREQAKGKRTISTSQVVGTSGNSANRNTSDHTSRGGGNASRPPAAAARSSGSGSGSGNRTGQSGQRHSTGRRTSATNLSRPGRQSRTHSTQNHRTSHGKTGNSGRR